MNFLLLALLFVISFLLAQKFIIHLDAERYRKKNIKRLKTKENFFKYFFSKFNFIKTKDDFLSKQGYPLNLNVISYYFLKSMLAITFCIAGIMNYHSYLIAIIFSTIGFFVIDLYIGMRAKERENEICMDLLNVIDSVYLQVSSGVPLKNSFKKQYENCNNKDFKKALIEFSTKYELSELNIVEATKVFKERFDIIEMSMFCKALESYNETSQIEDMLFNITEMLKKKKLEKLKHSTLSKILYITFGVVVALGNIIMITFYPLFVDIGQGFQHVFR